MMRLCYLFLLGAAMTTAVADPPPKADPPKLEAPFTDYVKFERVKDGKVVETKENVRAYLLKSGTAWRLRGTDLGGGRDGEPKTGDRFSTKDGAVYVITEKPVLVVSTDTYNCRFKKSP